MANELATTPPGAPPQAAEPKPRSWASDPWEARPPLAPVDPPPCSTDVAPAPPAPQIARAAETPPPQPITYLAIDPARLAQVLTPHAGYPQPTLTPKMTQTVCEPVYLGKETPAAELQALLDKAGYHANNRDQ